MRTTAAIPIPTTASEPMTTSRMAVSECFGGRRSAANGVAAEDVAAVAGDDPETDGSGDAEAVGVDAGDRVTWVAVACGGVEVTGDGVRVDRVVDDTGCGAGEVVRQMDEYGTSAGVGVADAPSSYTHPSVERFAGW